MKEVFMLMLSFVALIMAMLLPAEFTNAFPAIVLQFLVFIAYLCLDFSFRKRYAYDKNKYLFFIWCVISFVLISLMLTLAFSLMETVTIMTRKVFVVISVFCAFEWLLAAPQTTDEITEEEEKNSHEKN